MRPLPPTIALTLALGVLASASIAGAQGAHTGGAHRPTPTDPAAAQIAEAQRLYDRGSEAWHDARYDEALASFRASYDLGHRPEVLYDIGVTLDRLGQLEEAIDTFERYLREMPGAPNRVVVEQRITSLRQDVERARAEASRSGTVMPSRIEPRASGPVMTLMGSASGSGELMRPELVEIGGPPPPPAVPQDRGPEWIASWVFLALTAGAVIATPLLWSEGQARYDLLLADCTALGGCTEQEIADSPAHGYQDATNAMLGLSIGLGAITVLSFVLEGVLGGGPAESTYYGDLRVTLGPGSLGVSGRF